MSGEPSVLTWLPALGGLALKSLILFLVAGAALLALRRASASARHLVCLLTLAGLLALPLLSLGLPGWRLAVLASPAAPAAPSAVAVPVLVPAGVGTPTKVVPFAPPSARLASLLALPMPAPAPRPFPWMIALAALWLGGVLLTALRPLLGLWGIARLSQTSAVVLDAPTLALTVECAFSLSISKMPALRQADAPVPMTWGWWHPVVLLPADARGWPEGRLRAVLLHELAHVRRRDWLSHRLADAVCALYWFHPLAWLTARRLKMESEIACDDLVLTSGVAAPDYARHLLDVARALRPAAPALVPTAAIAMARTARIEGRLTMILDTARPRRALTRRALLLVLTPGVAALVTLAMLRLDSKAQAAPAPVAAAPALPSAAPPTAAVPRIKSPTGRPHGKAPATPVLTPKRQAALPPSVPVSATPRRPVVRVAQLPHEIAPAPLPLAPPTAPPMLSVTDLKVDGASLLAGVTDADKPGAPWWSASGALLPKPVYDTATYRAESHTFGGDTKNVIFTFRLPPASEGVTLAYRVSGALGSSSEGSWLLKMQGQEHKTETQTHSRSGGTRVLTAAFPASLMKTDIQAGIASGPWKVAATYGLGGFEGVGGTSVKDGDSTFVFSPASETKDGTVISIATDATDDLRVVAVDAQGRESLPDQPGDNSMGTLDQITVRFALPLAQIKEVRVETRPFRWIEIRDIALQPIKPLPL